MDRDRTDPTEPPIHVEGGSVVTLRLNRPDRLNAVSLPLYRALDAALTDLAGNPDARAVILTGTGRAFCAGADMKAYGDREPEPEERREYVRMGQHVNRQLQTMPKPVVAAVNGHAIGAGLELALSCDLIVVAEEAKLRLSPLLSGYRGRPIVDQNAVIDLALPVADCLLTHPRLAEFEVNPAFAYENQIIAVDVRGVLCDT